MEASQEPVGIRWAETFLLRELTMSSTPGKNLDAYFLSDLGKTFEARLASEINGLKEALQANRDKLAQVQQELNQERTHVAGMQKSNATADAQSLVAAAQERLLQDVSRIEEKARLASHFSEQAFSTATTVRAESTIEVRYLRELLSSVSSKADELHTQQVRLRAEVGNFEQIASRTRDALERTAGQLTDTREALSKRIDTAVDAVKRNSEDISGLNSTFSEKVAATAGLTTQNAEAINKLNTDLSERLANTLDLARRNAVEIDDLDAIITGQIEAAPKVVERMEEIRAEILSGLRYSQHAAETATAELIQREISGLRYTEIAGLEETLANILSAANASPSVVEQMANLRAEIFDELQYSQHTAETAVAELIQREINALKDTLQTTASPSDHGTGQPDRDVTYDDRVAGSTIEHSKSAGSSEYLQALKIDVFQSLASAHGNFEQNFIAALTDAHLKVAAMIEAALRTQSSAPTAATRNIDACLDWLAKNGESALTYDLKGDFEIAASEWSDDVFTEAAYLWLLGRSAEPVGLDHHLSSMRRGTSRGRFLFNLASSEEAITRLQQLGSLNYDETEFLHQAYTLFLGRGMDGAGQSHYADVLSRKGDRARVMVMRDIAHSPEAHLNRTPHASAWRFVIKANSLPVRWKRAWLRIKLGGRAAERHVWQVGRLSLLEIEAKRASANTYSRIDETHAELVKLLSTIQAAEHAHLSTALNASQSAKLLLSDANMSALAAPPPPPMAVPMAAEAVPIPEPHTSVADLLRDTSADKQVPQIASAIRAELQKLGLN